MHIAVCVKHVPSPEAAFSMFSIDAAGLRVVPASGLPWVISPFDEQAMEAALRIRDALPETRITAVTLGAENARATLKHALAMGADDALLLTDPAFDGGDGYATALALTHAIRELGAIDLVLTGRQAADDDAGVVGAAIAELSGLPLVSFASAIELTGPGSGAARVSRVLDDGAETVESPLPAVITVSNELGAARVPSLRETMRAARKPVTVRTAVQLGLSSEQVGAAGARSCRERVFLPPEGAPCEFVAGDTAALTVQRLLERLRETGAL